MCGIAGYITKKKYSNFFFKEVSKNLKKLMKRRGPNQQGSFEYNSSNCSINLFSSRLSIIDLSVAGNQPMEDSEKALLISYNGEIYNFLELKKDLIKSGVSFKSNSDTEVLLYGYLEWGIEALLKRLNGMFAFALMDKKNNLLYLCRDRFGQKPFYYYFICI